MGDERLTTNPQAAFLPKNTVEAYTFTLQKIVTGLARYDDSQKARDVEAVLKTAIVLLNEGESEVIPPTSDSPGVDSEGNELAPFTPMALPDGSNAPTSI